MRASRPEFPARSRREAWRAIGVLLVTVALCGDAAAAPAKSEPTAKPAAKTVATAPAKAPAAAKTATPAKTTTAARATAKAPAKATAKATTRPNAAAVSTKPSAVAPARTSVPGKTAASTLPSLEQQVTYQYNALGRRDPFMPMAGGTFIGDDVGGDAPPDIGGIKIVGIVWGASDKFALVEDARGASMVLRAGDPVMNGVVKSLKRDAMVVKLTVDGQSETVTIPLTRKGDQTNANR